jgi:hypothetical protein
MSAPGTATEGASKVMQLLFGIGITILICAVIYLCIAGGLTISYWGQFGRGNKDGWWYRDRETWIPKTWLDWAGYPGTFTKISSMSAPQMALKSVKTDVTSINQCMLKCAGMIKKLDAPECVGFVYDSAAKKCFFAETIDLVMPGSNTIYLYQNTNAGYTPSVKTFQAYTSNALPLTGTDAPKNVGNSPYTEGGGWYGCGANCYSNSECTGYTFVPSTNNCRLVRNMDATKLVATPGSNSYVYTNISGEDDLTTYWK